MVEHFSKKHHFVPVFYQKGFLSDQGELYAYKKKFGGIKDWTPSQILYQEHLHTVSMGSEKTVMIEQFLSQIEGKFKEYLSFIEDNLTNPDLVKLLIDDENFQRVAKLMVSMQFWRTPCKRQLAVEYSKNLVEQFDKVDDEIKEMLGHDRKFVRFLQKRANKDDSIKFIQFVLLPLLTFDLSKKVSNLKLFRVNGTEKLVTSDRPVIFDDLDALFDFKMFMFPFTKDLLLVGTDKDTKALSIKTVNHLIARKALDVVLSGSKAQLEDIKSYSQSIQAV
ncbi:DUF4238 domain-containing protein [Aeromonas veronii]|uniref:DUF4238 domain-containing protein n=1 Tax=Aeromonas veronii TaxID=654 RepID=UPI0035B770FE